MRCLLLVAKGCRCRECNAMGLHGLCTLPRRQQANCFKTDALQPFPAHASPNSMHWLGPGPGRATVAQRAHALTVADGQSGPGFAGGKPLPLNFREGGAAVRADPDLKDRRDSYLGAIRTHYDLSPRLGAEGSYG